LPGHWGGAGPSGHWAPPLVYASGPSSDPSARHVLVRPVKRVCVCCKIFFYILAIFLEIDKNFLQVKFTKLSRVSPVPQRAPYLFHQHIHRNTSCLWNTSYTNGSTINHHGNIHSVSDARMTKQKHVELVTWSAIYKISYDNLTIILR